MNKAHLHFPIKSVGGHGNWHKNGAQKGGANGNGDEMEYGDEVQDGDTDEELTDVDVDDASCHRLRQLLSFRAICRLRNCSL